MRFHPSPALPDHWRCLGRTGTVPQHFESHQNTCENENPSIFRKSPDPYTLIEYEANHEKRVGPIFDAEVAVETTGSPDLF